MPGARVPRSVRFAARSFLLALPALAVAAEPAAQLVTFAKDVAPILQEKCQECHRKGTAAPMPLITYEETRPWAKSIRERVARRTCPGSLLPSLLCR